MTKFTVDTHLFRELGELLVGRDSTALIELIKNAYDADATKVTVQGHRLDSPSEGSILITDDGLGMDAQEFQNGFLRIAARLKDQGERHSRLFQRRYTGAKGIGRLAAHKLARKLEVDSVPRVPATKQPREKLYAAIDWDEIERYETLDELNYTDAIVLSRSSVHRDTLSGTTLVLSHLRRAWTVAERVRFINEVRSFDPPRFLCNPLPPSVVSETLLFSTPLVRDQSDGVAHPFQVELEGDFAVGEDYWELVAEMANWVLEIRAEPGEEQVRFAISPTKKTLGERPGATVFHQSIAHPAPVRGPYFDARILVREGSPKLARDQRVWATGASGIRVFLEGFRVLPYGEPKDDWLSIDADYTKRPRQLEMLRDFGLAVDPSDPDVGLVRVPSNNYYGAVFLTQNRCPDLRVVVNREGFVPEESFEIMVRIVRTGVDFLTRVRAAASSEQRRQRRINRRPSSVGGTAPPRSRGLNGTNNEDVEARALPERIREAVHLVREASTQLTGSAKEATVAAIQELDDATAVVDDLISERTLLYILASVGTQMAAFVHEINALLGAAQTMEDALARMLGEGGPSPDQRKRLRHILGVATELRRGLERQASYLTEVVSLDARRRRSRQPLSERFDTAVRLVQHHAQRRSIRIDNQIPPELKSLPVFAAELTAVFANLLTNAVKAADDDGRIHASAHSDNAEVRIRIQNTGTAVNLDDAERWFKPFESTTSELDPVLGQGMGLGLTITRNLLENYGALIKFVLPDRPFATAVEVSLPIRSPSRS